MARKQFLLRIDPELWKQLEKWAADDLRSVNAQVEWLLREAVGKRKGGRRVRQERPGRNDSKEHEEDPSSGDHEEDQSPRQAVSRSNESFRR
jgi:hypothetical protein